MIAKILKSATLFLGFAGVLFISFANPTSAAGKANRILMMAPAFLSPNLKSLRASSDVTDVKMVAGRIDPVVTRKGTAAKKRKIPHSKRRSTDPLGGKIVRPTDDMNRVGKKGRKAGAKSRSKRRSTDPLKVIVRPTDDMNRGGKPGYRTKTGNPQKIGAKSRTNPLRLERAFDDEDDEKNALKKRSRKMRR